MQPFGTLVRSLIFQQTRTYRVKDVLKKRCEGCYEVVRKGVPRILCHENKKHKQKLRIEKKSPKVA